MYINENELRNKIKKIMLNEIEKKRSSPEERKNKSSKEKVKGAGENLAKVGVFKTKSDSIIGGEAYLKFLKDKNVYALDTDGVLYKRIKGSGKDYDPIDDFKELQNITQQIVSGYKRSGFVNKVKEEMLSRVKQLKGQQKNLSDVGLEIVKAYPKSKHIAYEIEKVSKNLDMNPFHLANLINFESGRSFSPSKAHGGGGKAVGLIQFMPSTAKSLGTSSSALASMSGPEQMKYVEKYLKDKKEKLGANFQKAEDVAMSVFFPNAVGKGPDYSIFDYYVKKYQNPKYKNLKFSSNMMSNKSYQKGIKEFGFKAGQPMNPDGSKEGAIKLAKTIYLYPNGGIETAGEYTKAMFRGAKLPTANKNPYGNNRNIG